jgi:hypothetical protein
VLQAYPSAIRLNPHLLPRFSVSAAGADNQERNSPVTWRVRMAVSGIGTAGTAGAVSAYALTPTLATKIAAPIDLRNIALSSASVSSTPSPAMTVTLGNPVTPDVTYGKPLPVDPIKLVWATPPADNDNVSQVMGQLKSADSSSLLSGLGAALLNRFASTQSDFQQSVVAYPNLDPNGPIDATANAAALKDAQYVQNNVGLTIHTASGKEVDISITFGGDSSVGDSLSINVHTSGKLSAAEQAAVAKLSKGFAAALQGITSDPPQVDVSGLVNFDPTVLSSVDLKVREPQSTSLQSLDFHADAGARSFAMQGAAGTVSVNVDLSKPALWGSKAQQQTALLGYLNQFDAANQRAQGGATLLGQFKDAFSELNSSYPVPGPQPAQAPTASALNTKNVSVLSGSADFQASMSGTSDNGSAAQPTTEAGQIDYKVSQHTETRGVAKSSGLSVAQTQAATLVASFEQSRDGSMLDTTNGNYDLYRINDSTSTTTSFDYADAKLQSAAINNQVNQSERHEKLVNHKVVEQTTTPHNISTVQDISAQLRPTL